MEEKKINNVEEVQDLLQPTCPKKGKIDVMKQMFKASCNTAAKIAKATLPSVNTKLANEVLEAWKTTKSIEGKVFHHIAMVGAAATSVALIGLGGIPAGIIGGAFASAYLLKTDNSIVKTITKVAIGTTAIGALTIYAPLALLIVGAAGYFITLSFVISEYAFIDLLNTSIETVETAQEQ